MVSSWFSQSCENVLFWGYLSFVRFILGCLCSLVHGALNSNIVPIVPREKLSLRDKGMSRMEEKGGRDLSRSQTGICPRCAQMLAWCQEAMDGGGGKSLADGFDVVFSGSSLDVVIKIEAARIRIFDGLDDLG